MQAAESHALQAAAGAQEMERIKKLKDQFLKAKPSLCVERAAAYTRSHQATEGEVLIVRRAKAFKETCQSIPAIILDPRTHCRRPGGLSAFRVVVPGGLLEMAGRGSGRTVHQGT